MAVKIDIIENASLTAGGGRVLSITRVARVSGLSGTSAVLLDALVAAGIPDDGTVHPDQNDNYVQGHEITPEPGGSSARVLIRYGFEPRINPIARGGTGTNQTTTQKDSGGTPIELTYGNNKPQGCNAPVYVQASTLILQLAEVTNTPGTIAKAFTNHTNFASWNGGATGTWLCTNVSFDELHVDLVTKVYLLTYQFAFNAEGWDPIVSYIDPQTDRPPADASPQIVTWYDQIDFNVKFP